MSWNGQQWVYNAQNAQQQQPQQPQMTPAQYQQYMKEYKERMEGWARYNAQQQAKGQQQVSVPQYPNYQQQAYPSYPGAQQQHPYPPQQTNPYAAKTAHPPQAAVQQPTQYLQHTGTQFQSQASAMQPPQYSNQYAQQAPIPPTSYAAATAAPAPPSRPAAESSLPGFAGWPLPLKEYVKRVFAECKDRDVANVALREKIALAVKDKTLWSRDWANEPLPTVSNTAASQLPPHLNSSTGSASSTAHTFNVNRSRKRERSQMGVKSEWPSLTPHTSQVYGNVQNSQMVQGINQPAFDNQSVQSGQGSTGGRNRKKKKKQKKKVGAQKTGLTTEEMRLREQRAARFSKQASEQPAQPSTWSFDEHRIKKLQVTRAIEEAQKLGEQVDLSKFVVIGTCTDLEKPYLRLTTAPDPAKVRPQPILKKSLEMIMKRYKAKEVVYLWACEQLKSIRQDLTVQHIQNRFTLEVYEAHAKISLQESDMKEFNQCQTQIQELISKLSDGATEQDRGALVKISSEFSAYRVFYHLYTRYKYGAPSSAEAVMLQGFEKDVLNSIPVQHALHVQSAVDQGDYTSFFHLYRRVPNLGKCLLDLVLGFIRHQALQRIMKSFRPNLPLSFIKDQLMFSSRMCPTDPGNQQVEEQWVEFLKTYPLTMVSDESGAQNAVVDTRASQAITSANFGWEVLDGDNVTHLESSDDV